MNAENANQTAPLEARERNIVRLLCVLAAVHVFVFCAAFPIGNNLDEPGHFDLIIKYAHHHLPHGLEPMCEEASQYMLVYGSPEFRFTAQSLPGGVFPAPSWAHQRGSEKEESERAAAFRRASDSWRGLKNLELWKNYESAQQPLYYAIAGSWWRLGRGIGLEGLQAVYWVRFLNVFFVAALVWAGYIVAKLLFPESGFVRLGVPALLAFLPQQAFYSMQNDVLSPLCFGILYIGLIKFWREETPRVASGVFVGLAMAAAFLVKLSGAPMLAVVSAVVMLKLFQARKKAGLRAALPAFIAWFICAAIPVCAWLAWTRHAFGDFTGTAAKLQFITWTRKPFAEWWHHPIFSPQGFWTFVSELIVNLWQGELTWHNSPLTLPVVDAIYVVVTLAFLALAAVKLRLANPEQRRALLLSAALCASGAAFLAYLSVSYDFGICPSPSKEHPYLVAGRLVSGALIPFLLLFVHGIRGLLHEAKKWVQFTALSAILLFMLVSEIVTDWPVFFSQYNWFHM